jgi:hypothetical protein
MKIHKGYMRNMLVVKVNKTIIHIKFWRQFPFIDICVVMWNGKYR